MVLFKLSTIEKGSLKKKMEKINNSVMRDKRPIKLLSRNSRGVLVERSRLFNNLYKSPIKKKDIHLEYKKDQNKKSKFKMFRGDRKYKLPDLPKLYSGKGIKKCPKGKILNVKTGRCNKISELDLLLGQMSFLKSKPKDTTNKNLLLSKMKSLLVV